MRPLSIIVTATTSTAGKKNNYKNMYLTFNHRLGSGACNMISGVVRANTIIMTAMKIVPIHPELQSVGSW